MVAFSSHLCAGTTTQTQDTRLPAVRTKTSAAVDIPLSDSAIECLRKLIELGYGSEYLLPARKRQDRMLPHIHENTLNVAMAKVKALMQGVENFTLHDFRRTARTHMAPVYFEHLQPKHRSG